MYWLCLYYLLIFWIFLACELSGVRCVVCQLSVYWLCLYYLLIFWIFLVIKPYHKKSGDCSVGQQQVQRDIVASVFVVLVMCSAVFEMVAVIQDIIAKYEERVRSMENVPRCLYSRRILRSYGGPNRSFSTYSPTRLWPLNF